MDSYRHTKIVHIIVQLLAFEFFRIRFFLISFDIFPSMTFVFKTASYRRQLCGRVIACQAIGFH